MSPTVTLILGNQLFQMHPALATETDYVMVESRALCSTFRYHKQKLAFILTSMRDYRDFLSTLTNEHSRTVHYYQYEQMQEFAEVFERLSQQYSTLQVCEIPDKKFARYVQELGKKYFSDFRVLASPMFLTSQHQMRDYLENRSEKGYLMANFYQWQRKRLAILMDGDTPIGGKWSFDGENRKKLPKNKSIPLRIAPEISSHWPEVCDLIQREFPDNPGYIDDVWLATNHSQAKQVLYQFLNDYLSQFGDYEDALTNRDPFIFHSTLSPYLNCGLLTPQQVLQELFDFLNSQPGWQTNMLNSVEGFVRQIIGWREWIKGLYDHVYDENLAEYNFFLATQDLPKEFYFHFDKQYANTPLKISLQKVEQYGYAHHIERLMIFANYMTLTEVKPTQAYTWFMEMFVDAYEWVMVPNVFGMGLYADGGLFATKPYVASSNYIKKMSDYAKGDWEVIWTNLFWNFLLKHEDFFRKNPRMHMLIQQKKKKVK